MQQIEKGTAAHHNLSLLFLQLWPQGNNFMVTAGEDGIPTVETKMSDDTVVSVFYKWGKKAEQAWVRFDKDGITYTYLLSTFWTKRLLGEAFLNKYQVNEDILLDIFRPRYELPTSWLTLGADVVGEYDDVTQEEFRGVVSLAEQLRKKIERNLAEITRKVDRFVRVSTQRDHDLYMTFNIKGEDKMTFALRFDKVYPKLPVEGFSLGEGPELAFDIADDDLLSKSVLNRLKILERLINKDVIRYRSIGQFGEGATKLFNKEVRTILFAATHFTKRLYPFDQAHGKPELMRVSNEILDALYAGRLRSETKNIGLDVNSWIVWEYPIDGTEPFRSKDPALNFQEIILEGYTESFTNCLMGYLMDLQHNDVVKPYHWLVKADAADGHAIGSVRMA